MGYSTDQETADRLFEERLGFSGEMPYVRKFNVLSQPLFLSVWKGPAIAAFSNELMDEINPLRHPTFRWLNLKLQIVAFDYRRNCYYVKRVPRAY